MNDSSNNATQKPIQGLRQFITALNHYGGTVSPWRYQVLRYLETRANEERRAWPSVHRIAKELGCSVNTVSASLKDLVAVKAIEEVPYDKRTKSQSRLPNAKKIWQMTTTAEIDGQGYWYVFIESKFNIPMSEDLNSQSVNNQMVGGKESTNKKNNEENSSETENETPSQDSQTDTSKPTEPTSTEDTDSQKPKLKTLTVDEKRISKILDFVTANPHFSEESEVALGHQGQRGTDTLLNAYSLLCKSVDDILAPPPPGAKNQTDDTRRFAAQVKEYLINSTYAGQKKRRATAQNFIDFIYWYANENPDYEYLPGFSKSGKGNADDRATKFIKAYESYRADLLTTQRANCTQCPGDGMVVKGDEIVKCECSKV
jgi:DNA-binding MarR family transcriptional regulator